MKNFIIIIAVFLLILICFIGKDWLIKPPSPSVSSNQIEENATPNRNTFIHEITRQPEPADWSAIELFTMAMQTLEPKQSITSVFQDNLKQFGQEPYYAGSWKLKDGTSCPLLWLADNQQFSFGIKWTGKVQQIRQLANDINAQLGKPTLTETDNCKEKYYWLQKKYRNMDYFIGCTLVITEENATLDLNVHPQIYH